LDHVSYIKMIRQILHLI